MSHLEYIRRLYVYNDWANRETFASLGRENPLNDLTQKRMAHILAAEYTWHARLTSQESPVPVWPALSLEEIGNHLTVLRDGWTMYLESLNEQDLAGTIDYTNSRGTAFTSRRDDILQHVVMHGAYHRGQIAGDVRSAGGEPAGTDFIFCVRGGVI